MELLMSLNYRICVLVWLGALQGFWTGTSPAFSSPIRLAENTAPEDTVKTVLSRPLFAPSRRPDTVAVQSDTLPVLTGIVHSAGQDGALFRGEQNSAGHLVHQGESIAGWHIIAVTREAVTLERGGHQIVQRPDFQHHQGAEGVTQPRVPDAGE
ncbi:hypothetical protein ACI01nite_23540 [Acetobacter cibinongensis]|uniref:Type II secretion system protein GspC N-terminal domain-containing protein n=2 Tax=Acetobacter cibinongensis TaxID=146475 RepID=A0A0D6N545_9PROT|nr:hypothetical protein Abci_014_048 [Acetobacter cibinongensis]GBQ14630.1 hypothetical protein AA0482_0969 [Acetobacter cibinongensis NRIC 0482]GEL59752.1 hypothetical protein ACI01nite_23540 [Acetobacter cibinongensis]